ncbi:MAG: hypothetical protein ABIP51_05535 [Bacteroidia bacterium]
MKTKLQQASDQAIYNAVTYFRDVCKYDITPKDGLINNGGLMNQLLLEYKNRNLSDEYIASVKEADMFVHNIVVLEAYKTLKKEIESLQNIYAGIGIERHLEIIKTILGFKKNEKIKG